MTDAFEIGDPVIAHTLLYRFPETVSEHAKDEFFSAMRDMLAKTGVIHGFDLKPHILLPADANARTRFSEFVVQFTCATSDELENFSQLPHVHEFLKAWREKVQFEVAYINHEPLTPAPLREAPLNHAEHAVTVDAPLEIVWEVLVDVLNYPDIFAPTQSVTMVDERPGYQLARFVVEIPSGETLTWVSRRDIDAAAHVIAYEQIDKAPMVAHMSGQWRAFPLPANTTQLVLTHDYAARVPTEGEFAGKLSRQQAEQLLDGTVERNSVADLNAVKAEAERRFDMAMVAAK